MINLYRENWLEIIIFSALADASLVVKPFNPKLESNSEMNYSDKAHCVKVERKLIHLLPITPNLRATEKLNGTLYL